MLKPIGEFFAKSVSPMFCERLEGRDMIMGALRDREVGSRSSGGWGTEKPGLSLRARDWIEGNWSSDLTSTSTSTCTRLTLRLNNISPVWTADVEILSEPGVTSQSAVGCLPCPHRHSLSHHFTVATSTTEI